MVKPKGQSAGGTERTPCRRPLWTPIGLQTAPLGGSGVCNSMRNLVGPPRFELGTSCTPSKKYQSLTDHATLKTKDLAAMRFGRQMDAKTPIRAVWTPCGLHRRPVDTTSCVGVTSATRSRELQLFFVAQGLTLEGFKVVMEVAHPPRVEGVTMPSTMGGISLFCPLQFELPPLLFKLAPLMGRLHAERSPRQVVDSVVA